MTLVVVLTAGCATEDREIQLIRQYEKCTRESTPQAQQPEHDPFRCDPIRDQLEALKRSRPSLKDTPPTLASSAMSPQEQQRNQAVAHARRLQDKGQYREEEAELTRVLEQDPNNVQAHIGRGNARVLQGRMHEALSDYSGALEVDPNSAGAYNNRAIVEHLEQNDEAARRDLERAATLAPGDQEIQANRRLLSASQPSSPGQPLQPAAPTGAEALIHQGHYEDALHVLDKVVASNPRSTAALFQRGTVRQLTGNFDGAIADLTALLDRDPSNVDALINRAYAFEKRGDRDRAIADLERAVISEPSNKEVIAELERLRAHR